MQKSGYDGRQSCTFAVSFPICAPLPPPIIPEPTVDEGVIRSRVRLEEADAVNKALSLLFFASTSLGSTAKALS